MKYTIKTTTTITSKADTYTSKPIHSLLYRHHHRNNQEMRPFAYGLEKALTFLIYSLTSKGN